MKKVLIVDDNELNITILLNLLSKNYDVSVALSGVDALESLEEEIPDLIVLDIVMPDMGGVDVCRKIKSDERTKHIPVIFLTAAHTLEDEAYKVGAVDFVGKPFNLAELSEKVEKFI